MDHGIIESVWPKWTFLFVACQRNCQKIVSELLNYRSPKMTTKCYFSINKHKYHIFAMNYKY